MSVNKSRCAWIKDRGYWKGYPCGAVAPYEFEGRRYCGAHLAMTQDPQRAAKQVDLRAAWERGEQR